MHLIANSNKFHCHSKISTVPESYQAIGLIIFSSITHRMFHAHLAALQIPVHITPLYHKAFHSLNEGRE